MLKVVLIISVRFINGIQSQMDIKSLMEYVSMKMVESQISFRKIQNRCKNVPLSVITLKDVRLCRITQKRVSATGRLRQQRFNIKNLGNVTVKQVIFSLYIILETNFISRSTEMIINLFLLNNF